MECCKIIQGSHSHNLIDHHIGFFSSFFLGSHLSTSLFNRIYIFACIFLTLILNPLIGCRQRVKRNLHKFVLKAWRTKAISRWFRIWTKKPYSLYTTNLLDWALRMSTNLIAFAWFHPWGTLFVRSHHVIKWAPPPYFYSQRNHSLDDSMLIR
jgi:hypothetical protein